MKWSAYANGICSTYDAVTSCEAACRMAQDIYRREGRTRTVAYRVRVGTSCYWLYEVIVSWEGVQCYRAVS